MPTVRSPIRSIVKPILHRLAGKRGYRWALYRAKLKDIEARLLEDPEMELLPQLLHDGDEAIDIGANYAYYTTRLSKLIGSGRVFAFEPIVETYQVCQRLLRRLRVENVELFPYGVGREDEELEFHVPVQRFGIPDGGLAHVAKKGEIEAKHETAVRRVVSIDSFLLPRLRNLTFVKIDVEGVELAVLEGMTETLHRFQPVLLVELEDRHFKGFGWTGQNVLDLVERLGYRIYQYNRERKELDSHDESRFNGNYFLVHRSKANTLPDARAM